MKKDSKCDLCNGKSVRVGDEDLVDRLCDKHLVSVISMMLADLTIGPIREKATKNES